MTKAILIDPFNKVIKEVKYDYGGKYTQIIITSARTPSV